LRVLGAVHHGDRQLVNYYSRHIGDYLRDTSHLSLLEHGIYTRLMDVYYTRECALPHDGIARLIGAKSEDELLALASVLREFFVREDEGDWVQPRCEREVTAYHEKSAKAKASADARWAHTGRNANAMRTHSEGNAPISHEPVTNKEKPAARALVVDNLVEEGIELETATDFLAQRKRKRAPLTPKAWAGIKAEIDKAGWTPQDALAKCLARGWIAFEADWVKDERTKRADSVVVTVPGPKPSGWLEAEAEHRKQVEADRIARKQREAA
jgi:uncharacterized protein YdaU (DUF1376 family)